MAEVSRFWGGTSIGDKGPYSHDQYNRVFYTLMGDGNPNAGVAVNYLNELNVASAGNVPANPITVDTGAAFVAGIYYTNTASENLACAAPVAPSPYRTDTVVLRANWAAQTVRLFLKAGTASASYPAAAPALTQTIGTTYEIPLFDVQLDSTGAVTLVNRRMYALFQAFTKPLVAKLLFGRA